MTFFPSFLKLSLLKNTFKILNVNLTYKIYRFQIFGFESLVLSCHKCGLTWPCHGPGAICRPYSNVPSGRSTIFVFVRCSPGARGRRGFGCRPGWRTIVRVFSTVLLVLRPTRPSQEYSSAVVSGWPPVTIAQVWKIDQSFGYSHCVLSFLRVIRASVCPGQRKRHINHGRVYRIWTHVEAQVHQRK